MAATQTNLDADQGATFNLSVQYKDSTGAPVDLTGYTATFSLYTISSAVGTPLFTKAGTTASTGWITVKATNTETAAWTLGKLAYRLDITSPTGDVTRLLFGAFNVRSGIDV